MCSAGGDTTQLVPGYPIRTPWDHSSVDSSPRPIAASHVLHRLLVPRHPPSALSNLTTKMLASTVQFSTNNHPHPPDTTRPRTPQTTSRTPDQFCEQRMDDHPEQTTPDHGVASTTGGVGLVPSGPNRVSAWTPPPAAPDRFHTPTRSPRSGSYSASSRCRP